MVKPLDSYVVCKIVTLREMGLSYKEVEEKLGLKSQSTAQIAYQRFLRTNSYVAKKPPGRPERLSEKGQRLIVRRVEKDPKSRERPKSAPYLRLKNEKGDPPGFVKLQLAAKKKKTKEGGTLWRHEKSSQKIF